MLSLQPNHQVVFQLSQLSNCLNATTTQVVNGLRNLTTKSADGSYPPNDIVCYESLEETVKNCSGEMALVNFPKIHQRTHQSNKRLAGWKNSSGKEELKNIVDLLSPLKPLPLKDRYYAPWEISFVSTKSFDGNKSLGFQKLPPTSGHSSMYILKFSSLHPQLLQAHNQGHQRRGFKTERIIVKEKEQRNSSIFGQMANSLSLPIQFNNPSSPQKGANAKAVDAVAAALEKGGDTKSVNAVASALVKIYGEGVTAGKGTEKLKKYRWFLYGMLAATLIMGARSFVFMKNFPFSDSIKSVSPEEIEVTFSNVRGMEEVKKELITVVNFLKSPKKFAALGARLPKGVLLVGEPGVGKTLLARAVAGEAQVPFFYASGSEFDELLVGEGARKIRNLFRIAKANAPCVIFLDEIDSVGGKRSNSSVHPYANQSINQLLSEMDGFQSSEGVVVLAATNRESDLDSALVRPGRFDMSIKVPRPRMGDRRDIIQYYLQKIACRNIDIDVLVKMTAGWNGANLENMLNWAAIIAATEDSEHVNMRHIHNAFDRIVLGVSWGNANESEMQDSLRRTAYHEAGHALISVLTPGNGVLHKVTIEARGQSLGHTETLPENDDIERTKAEFKAEIDKCFGGIVGEELIYGTDHVGSGSSSDLAQATNIAKLMVRRLGMGATNRHLGDAESLAGEAQVAIDKNIDSILNESKERVKDVLLSHVADLHKIAGALLEYKTLSGTDVLQLLGTIDDANSSKDP